MTSAAQRRSCLRLTLGLLYLGLALVACPAPPPEEEECEIVINDPNGGETSSPCELKEHKGSAGCTGATSQVSKGPESAPSEVVEASGGVDCDGTATLPDGSAQASHGTVNSFVTSGGRVVCTFSPVDSTERGCSIDADFIIFHRNFTPGAVADYLSMEFDVFEIGEGLISLNAQATADCGFGDEVITAGERRVVFAGAGNGSCTWNIHLDARTAGPGENAAVAVVKVGAHVRDCFGNAACQQQDPQTPCCGPGFDGCNDCSVGNRCSHDIQCADGLSCTFSICSEGNPGDFCETDFDCADSLVCIDRLCAQAAPCNPVDNEGCELSERCCAIGRVSSGVKLNAGCCPEGAVPPGEPCTVDSSLQDNCTGGYVCALGSCREICQDVPDSCPQGEACDALTYGIQNVPGDNTGVCLPLP